MVSNLRGIVRSDTGKSPGRGGLLGTQGLIFNRILQALPPAVGREVLGVCRRVEFPAGHVIFRVGAALEDAYFVDSGLVCLVKRMADGRSVEIAAVGAEGLVGAGAAFETDRAIADYVVQVPIAAHRITRSALQREVSRHDALRCLLTRYLFLLREQLAQISACNRLHSLEQRCCYWLLVAHDSVLADEFQLTHEFLASLLGVQRPSLSMTANGLQKRGFLSYRYGRITIFNRAALEERACECYHAHRRKIDQTFGLSREANVIRDAFVSTHRSDSENKHEPPQLHDEKIRKEPCHGVEGTAE